jgi:uncharacterized protein YraI
VNATTLGSAVCEEDDNQRCKRPEGLGFVSAGNGTVSALSHRMNVGSILVTVVAVSGFFMANTASAREVCGAPSGLNLRTGPSLHSRVKDVLSDGSNFGKVLGDSANGKWLKVRAGGQTGWVFRGYTCGESRRASRDNASSNNGGSGRIAHYRNPVAGTCVTSDFGPRTRPTRGASSYHQGCDLGAGCGTPIKATAPGRVVFAGYQSGYGNTVIIQHPNGTRSLYGHMSRINVRSGQQPGMNTVIGRVGATGTATGCHLHFGIISGGRFVDPQRFIGQRGCPGYGVSSGARWLRP